MGSFRASAAAAIALVALVAAGCGGSPSKASTPPGAGDAGAAAFERSVDALCRAAKSRIDAIARPGSVRELRSTVEQTAAVSTWLRDGLGALTAPGPARAEALARLRAYLERDRALSDDLLLALEAENAELSVSLAGDLEASHRAEDRVLRQLGCRAGSSRSVAKVAP
jgi:hypothetical protein